jgi:hypothetical protein
MAVPGVFASDQNIVGTRTGDFASSILSIQPTGNSPLFALSSGMPTKDAKDSIVHWFEETKISGRVQVTSINGDGQGVTMTVNDGSSYFPGVVLLHEASGEYVMVNAVAGNVLTIERQIGGTSLATMAANDYLQRIGTAHEEGSSMPTPIANLGTVRFNVTQIFRNAWAVTGTAKAIDYHTGSVIAKNKSDCGFFHGEDIERSLMWGVRHIGTRNNQPIRLMDGLVKQVRDNSGVTSTEATVKWRTHVIPFFRDVFAYNIKGKPNERIGFCGNKVVQVFGDLAAINSQNNVTAGETEFGMKITTIITAFGTLKLVTHPLMNENAVWTKNLYVFHPGAIRTRWLRKTFIEGYDQNNQRVAGIDADQGAYTSELSIEYMAGRTGGLWEGMNAGAAD